MSARLSARLVRSLLKHISVSRCVAKRRSTDEYWKQSRMEMERTSKRYALLQTALLILFGAVLLLSPRNYLFVSATAAVAGNLLCGAGLLLICARVCVAARRHSNCARTKARRPVS